MKTQNDKVSEEVRELVYSDYNNKYEQLKSELNEKEKELERIKHAETVYNELNEKKYAHDPEYFPSLRKRKDFELVHLPILKDYLEGMNKQLKVFQFPKKVVCQAKIEYLKKGISACEEILNQSQQQNDRKINLGETTLVDGMQTIVTQENISADTPTLIKQALSQRNQEILEILNKYKNTFCDLCEEDYQKLKKQLTTKEEGKA